MEKHTEQELIRRDSLQKLKELGINPYPADEYKATSTSTDLKKGFSIDIWNKLHLQIIFYGREYCTARGCDGRVCSICTEINKGRKSPIITNKA